MKKYNPTSPGRRHAEAIDASAILTRQKPHKPLVRGFKRDVGRNSQGRITTRHKGGGVKRLWRDISFSYDKINIPAKVESLEYDPNRTGFIALIIYQDGERRYILAPQSLKVGKIVIASENAPLEPGNCLPLKKIPIGTVVYNVELNKGEGGKIARSAGVGAIIIAQEEKTSNIQLPSKEIRKVNSENWASIGEISNPEHAFITIGKAGRSRKKGVRPSVRGSAMNPVDHPHGGGEGRTQRGRRRGPATPWGKLARGVKTRKKKNRSDVFIISKRKK